MRLLVVGGAGYVGSILRPALEAEHDYYCFDRQKILDEDMPADAWHPYGISKHLGERLCQAAAVHYPAVCIVALRLMFPRSEPDFKGHEYKAGQHNSCALAPEDVRRLFLAAVSCDRPGAHIVQATGDLEDKSYPNTRAAALLGWRPRGN